MNNSEKNSKGISALLLLTVFILLVIADQVTKYMAVVGLKGKEAIVLINGVLELRYLENRGAAFSMLVGQQWFFYILTVVFLIAAVIIVCRMPKDKKYDGLRWCAAVLCAGAVGNLIDRVLNKYVVDFIYFSLIDFPIFNVADIYVTMSVIVLILLVLFYYKDEDLNILWEKKSE